ncbi:unnamed protein product [Penicillium salamii]|nr:unnamed protein product [Penicillium salamii]CAG8384695.1 unnamed protein product [Penicillium salamii]
MASRFMGIDVLLRILMSIGLKIVELLQDMVFPDLKGGPIDDIIDKCWHSGYATIAELGTFTERLFNEENGREHDSELTDREDQSHTVEDDLSKNTLCQELEKDGLLRLLCSGEPEELGFKLEWYRHAS